MDPDVTWAASFGCRCPGCCHALLSLPPPPRCVTCQPRMMCHVPGVQRALAQAYRGRRALTQALLCDCAVD